MAVTYSYTYVIESTLTPAVGHHFFKLRVLPLASACQRVVESRLSVSPDCVICHARDGFGNDVQYGGISSVHDTFRIESSGTVECSRYAIPDSEPSDIYLFPTTLTAWDADIRRLAREASGIAGVVGSEKGNIDKTTAGDTPAAVCEIMHRVHQSLAYERFATGNTTTAIEALGIGKGVCQDYAHLMIAACRSVGIRARYVNGLMLGEGETHAWVEAYDGKQWLGYDPTHDAVIDYGYIKFAHGRDVGDCPSNRGRFYCWTSELMQVKSLMESRCAK